MGTIKDIQFPPSLMNFNVIEGSNEENRLVIKIVDSLAYLY